MTSEAFFESLQLHFNDNLPFVAYRKPNEIEVKLLLQKDATLHQASGFTESGFVFAPFNNHNQTILIPLNNSKFMQSEFVMTSHNATSDKETNVDSDQRPNHIKLVKKAIDTIRNKELKKVVLSRCEHVQLSEANPIHLFQKLLSNYATAFVYCWYHPKVGLWLGATPETLLKTEGNRVSTMALAGTQKFEGKMDIEWQNKEKEEQQIVTDFIVDNLQSSVNNISVSKPETIKAGNLLHLQTKITASLKPETQNLKLILAALHPTPAVCGFPKEEAKHFILKNENYNREFYTGFLGELNFKETRQRNTNRKNVENSAYSSVKVVSNLFVNLRCMQLKKNVALIYVGGGITNESNSQLEWEETLQKAKTIKSIL